MFTFLPSAFDSVRLTTLHFSHRPGPNNQDEGSGVGCDREQLSPEGFLSATLRPQNHSAPDTPPSRTGVWPAERGGQGAGRRRRHFGPAPGRASAIRRLPRAVAARTQVADVPAPVGTSLPVPAAVGTQSYAWVCPAGKK